MEIKGVNASATLFYNMVIKRGRLLDCIKRKLRAVKHLQITVRLDGYLTPHTGHGNFEKLRARGQVVAGTLCSNNSPQTARI